MGNGIGNITIIRIKVFHTDIHGIVSKGPVTLRRIAPTYEKFSKYVGVC